MQPDPHILGHGPEAAIQHEPVKGDTEWKVSPGSFDAQEKLMNMRTDKIRGMIDHEHVLQGLSFGGMTISGVARNKQLSCYKPDSFPGNLEPIVMTADGLPAPDQLETAEVGPDGSVSHHIPVFKGDSVEDALAHVLSRCAKLEECASVGIDAHPHCPRAGADTQPYALLHVTYCTGDLHTLHVQLMDAMDNMAMFPEEEEGDPVFGASPHDDRHEHDGPSSRCEAAGVAAWDIWEPMALEVCGSASVPCQSPHDRCHWGVDDHPLPWRMHGRGWSGPQCIRHLVKAHRHGEAEAVEDVDALLPDIVPRERVYASVVDLGVVPEVVRDFGVHNANLSAVYGTAAYPIRVTHDGVRLEPTDAIQAPTMSFVAEQGRYYALAMVDPDAPSRQDPRFRAWNHWLVGNIQFRRRGVVSPYWWKRQLAKATVLTEYIGPTPPQGTGPHRYVFTLFEQPGDEPIHFEEPYIATYEGKPRAKFNVQRWANKYDLGYPVGVAAFKAQWDTAIHKNE